MGTNRPSTVWSAKRLPVGAYLATTRTAKVALSRFMPVKKKLHEWNPLVKALHQKKKLRRKARKHLEDKILWLLKGTSAQEEEYYDDDAGAPYWYNTTTGESTTRIPLKLKLVLLVS